MNSLLQNSWQREESIINPEGSRTIVSQSFTGKVNTIQWYSFVYSPMFFLACLLLFLLIKEHVTRKKTNT